MDSKRLKNLKSFYLFFLILSLSILPSAFAQQHDEPEYHAQEASASQAQATLASLFGGGVTMPDIPRISGTIALPSFDSSGMIIDQNSLVEAHRVERSSGNVERNV